MESPLKSWLSDTNRGDRYLHTLDFYLRKMFGRDGEVSSIDIIGIYQSQPEETLRKLVSEIRSEGFTPRIERVVLVVCFKSLQIAFELQLEIFS